VVCRACCKTFKRLLAHLNSKNGNLCKSFYTEEELRKPSKSKVFYDKHKKKILDKKKKYSKENTAKIKDYKRTYYKQNKSEVREKDNAYKKRNKIKLSGKKQAEYICKLKQKRANLSLFESLSMFRKEIVWGAIYPCISCHRTCFRNGVKVVKSEVLNKFSIFQEAVQASLVEKHSTFTTKGSLWICHNCNLYIRRNKMPKISCNNSLQIYDRPDFLNLTEVENVLIAPRKILSS
jgi:hypothetical protein